MGHIIRKEFLESDTYNTNREDYMTADDEQKIYNYGYDEYQLDIRWLVHRFSNKQKLHLIGISRGGASIAIHLSNLLDCEISILDIRTRHNKLNSDPKMISRINDLEGYDTYVLDDIFDTGKTMIEVEKYLNWFYGCTEKYYKIVTLFGNQNEMGVEYINEQNNRWIIFPWERI